MQNILICKNLLHNSCEYLLQKIRCFLIFPSIGFFFIQMYGVVIEGIYKFRPHWFPEVMEKYNQEGSVLNRLQADYWMDMVKKEDISCIFLVFF